MVALLPDKNQNPTRFENAQHTNMATNVATMRNYIDGRIKKNENERKKYI